MSDTIPQAVAEGWARTVADLAILSVRHAALREALEALKQEMLTREYSGEGRFWAQRITMLLTETS